MVVAVSGLCQAAGWPLGETARIANAAAGLEIEQLGIAPVTWDQILERYAASGCHAASVARPEALRRAWPGGDRVADARRHAHPAGQGGRVARPEALRRAWSSSDRATDVQRHAHPAGLGVPPNPRQTVRAANKIMALPQLTQLVAEHRAVGKSIVFTNGCFDLLHVGHVTFLQEAAELGDVLIVAINGDAGVRRLKGPSRPVIGQSDRASMLASLACVDHVLIFDELAPHQLLDCLRPDVLVKGGTTTDVVGREVVEAYGGKVCTTAAIGASSTTQIVENIRQESELREKSRAVNA